MAFEDFVPMITGGLAAGGTALAGAPQFAGQAYGLGSGLGQMAVGASKKNQANKLGAPLEDPEQRQILNDIKRRRRQIELGTDTQSEFIRSNIAKQQAAQMRAGARATGGSVGATLQSFNQASRTAGNALNRLGVTNAQRAGALAQQASAQVDKIAQRKMDLQMWNKLQKMRESAELQKAGMANLAGGIASVSGGLGGNTKTIDGTEYNLDYVESRPTGTVVSNNDTANRGLMVGNNTQNTIGLDNYWLNSIIN